MSSTAKARGAKLADDAFAHLFEALQEGVYIGFVSVDETATLAANPHLRLMFGWAPDDARRRDRCRSTTTDSSTSRRVSISCISSPATARCARTCCACGASTDRRCGSK